MSLITYLTCIQFSRGDAGLVERVLAVAGIDAAAPVFDGPPENPTEAALAGCDRFRKEGCDSIVALVGGFPLDLAKAVASLGTHAEPRGQCTATLGGVPRMRTDKPPVVAVPTTGGTGSEVGRISPALIPDAPICGPEPTFGLPAYLTAATGMDTVTHGFETYLSPRCNPPADAIALGGTAAGPRTA